MEYEVIKFENDNVELEVNVSPEEETVWLSLSEMCLLFDRDKSVVSRHINNIYKEGELDRDQTVAKNATVQNEGTKTVVRQIDYYNLDVILAVGHRVKSNNGNLLKRFLDEYLSKNNSLSSNIIIYNNGNINLAVNVSPNEETVWLNVNQIAALFDTSTDNVYLHIKNIKKEGELDGSLCKDSLLTEQTDIALVEKSSVTEQYHKKIPSIGSDGKTYEIDYYNFDMILAVGYRVKSPRAIEFRRWVSTILKKYLLKGYVINEDRAIVTQENYLNLVNKVDALDNRVTKIEKKEKRLLVQDKIIYENHVFDALVIMARIIETAKETILLIDPYVDALAIDTFKNKSKGTELIVITSSKAKIEKHEIDKFNEQYGNLTIMNDDRIHDRYLILDDEMFYHVGSSINYLGKRLSQITLIEDPDVVEALRKKFEAYVLEKKIREGLDDIEAGRVLSADEVSKLLEDEFGIK